MVSKTKTGSVVETTWGPHAPQDHLNWHIRLGLSYVTRFRLALELGQQTAWLPDFVTTWCYAMLTSPKKDEKGVSVTPRVIACRLVWRFWHNRGGVVWPLLFAYLLTVFITWQATVHDEKIDRDSDWFPELSEQQQQQEIRHINSEKTEQFIRQEWNICNILN